MFLFMVTDENFSHPCQRWGGFSGVSKISCCQDMSFKFVLFSMNKFTYFFNIVSKVMQSKEIKDYFFEDSIYKAFNKNSMVIGKLIAIL